MVNALTRRSSFVPRWRLEIDRGHCIGSCGVVDIIGGMS